MLSNLSDEAQALIEDARSVAAGRGHYVVGTEHLMLALLKSHESKAAEALNEIGVPAGVVECMLLSSSPRGSRSFDSTFTSFLPTVQRIISAAPAEPSFSADHLVRPVQIFLALIGYDDCNAVGVLRSRELGVDTDELRRHTLGLIGKLPTVIVCPNCGHELV